MTTFEKIRAEIAENQKVISETLSFDKENEFYNGKWAGFELSLAIIDKYAEQEPSRDMKEIEEILKCDADAETKCKMISNILTAKPHYFAEQEPCDDAISRQAVIEWLKAKDIIKMSSQEEMARKELKALPSVRPQEKTGHWIKYQEPWGGMQGWKCSKCKNHYDVSSVYTIIPYNFCPNCGAKMVEPQESEE